MNYKRFMTRKGFQEHWIYHVDPRLISVRGVLL